MGGGICQRKVVVGIKEGSIVKGEYSMHMNEEHDAYDNYLDYNSGTMKTSGVRERR
jgi:hypothetical protein